MTTRTSQTTVVHTVLLCAVVCFGLSLIRTRVLEYTCTFVYEWCRNRGSISTLRSKRNMLRGAFSFAAHSRAHMHGNVTRAQASAPVRRTLASAPLHHQGDGAGSPGEQGDGASSPGETVVSDSQFHRVADATLDLLCERLETLEDEFHDFDLTLTDGVLKLDFGSHGHGSWVRVGRR